MRLRIKPLARATRGKLGLCLALFCLAPMYQNCGEFRPQNLVSTLSSNTTNGESNSGGPGGSTPQPTPPPTVELDGAALYRTNCAACHGSLEDSTKKGKNAATIKAAIGSIEFMKVQAYLVALTDLQINAISKALGGTVMIPTPTPQPDGGTPTPTATPVAPVGQCDANVVRGASKEGVRRLTREELKASVLWVLPDVDYDIQDLLNSYPDTDVVEEVEKYDSFYSPAQALKWAEIVDKIADTITKRNLISRLGDACLQAATVSESCWNGFFTNFGKKVYRRPLTSEEVARLTSTMITQPDRSTALYEALHMLFRSPAFLFHFEPGVSDEAKRVHLSDFEIANRISFAMLGAPPDPELWAAAEKGQLKTLAQVEVQVRRLLETSTAKNKLKRFFAEWLELGRIQSPQEEYMVFFRELGSSRGVDKMMVQEIQDYVNHIFFKSRGSFTDLMTQPIAFPRFQGLYYSRNSAPFSAIAGIYTDDPFSGFTPENQQEAVPFPAPNNPGLLTRAGFLTTSRWTTHPINRGVFVQRRILCEPLPSPDFSVVNQRLEDVGSLDPMKLANHQIVTAQTGGSSCIACHGKINPVGFALESFDMMGKKRAKEDVLDINQFYSAKKGIIATHDLPATISNVPLGDKVVSVSGPLELAQQVASSTRAKSCLANFVIRHYDRRVENAGDSCAVSEATNVLQSNQPVMEVFVKSLANDDIFWRRK